MGANQRDESRAPLIIVVGALVAPLALALAPLLLISIGVLHYQVFRRLAQCVDLPVDKKRIGPFTWPLLSTMVSLLLMAGSHALFDDPTQIVGAVAGSALFFALVLSPLTLYVPSTLDATEKPSLEKALRHWDAVPLKRRIVLTFLRVAPSLASSIVFLLMTRVANIHGGGLSIVSCVYVLALGFYQWETLSTYVDTPRKEERAAGLASTRWRLLLPVVLGLLAAGPIALAISYAAARPAPMGLSGVPDGRVYGGRSEYSVPESDLRIVPGRVGVAVMREGRAVSNADYGVYCLEQEAPELSLLPMWGGVHIYVNGCDRWFDFMVDAEGERIGDDVVTRVLRRVGSMTSLVVLLGLMLLIFAMARLLPSFSQARRIAAVVQRKDLEAATQQTIVEGVLRLSADELPVKRGKLEGEGTLEITLDGDRFNLPLPPSVACAKGEYRNGEKVSLVGIFSAVTRGHRDATIPWPERAYLVASGADEARTQWLWMATRLARFSAIGATFSLVCAYALFVLHISNV